MNMINMIEGNSYRITVLTDRLIRLEYQKNGVFENRLTQMVMNRDFPDVEGDIRRRDNMTEVETKELLLTYNGEPFSSIGLSIYVKQTGRTWHYSIVYGNTDRNLYGTARTLDQTDGFVQLDDGIFGLNGYGVIDDSSSPVFEDGEFKTRKIQETDIYFFGYGKDFYGGLRDYYALCGKTPMIPRYALGNWWSRYFRYTEKSYMDLLDRFESEEIPLSVAVLDMDWHVTEVDAKYGTGWTGYTWDETCFPNHKRFLKELKKRKLASTLNLHPADGIRGFEAMYPAVAKRMGIDPSSETPVEHDFSDRKYREAYFEEVIHLYEDDGVDFWWIDWQQGTGRREGEVDPLLLLNHYHYEDSGRDGRRPMIFSRYAGPGSHRYPLGFSGDTFTTWRSLALQPYFTSTASNIGYGWWSHDIGGHMLGDKDDERLIRWIQFGVFSPVMRIHSSNSPFFNKEPWTLEEPYHTIMADMLRLRHRLIPYLYTESYHAHKDGIPLVQPVYYRFSDKNEAYSVPNEYLLGSSLIICAITEPEDRKLHMASVNAYIPAGRWYDVFTGRIYDSDGVQRKLYRPLTSIPVLIPAGGIVPESLCDKQNGTDNPAAMRLLIAAGADGSYTLYEDDGLSQEYTEGKFCTTEITFKWGNDDSSCTVSIGAATGETSLIPDKRSYEICLYGIQENAGTVISCSEDCPVTVAADAVPDPAKNRMMIKLDMAPVNKKITINISGIKLAENDKRKQVFDILERARIETSVKEAVYMKICETDNDADFIRSLSAMNIPETLKDAIEEVILIHM